MADRFEVHATNDITSVLIARKYSMQGALLFANEILECWDDVFVREYDETGEYKIVGHISSRGLLL